MMQSRFQRTVGGTAENLWFVVTIMLICGVIGMIVLLLQTRGLVEKANVATEESQQQLEGQQQAREDILAVTKQIRRTNDLLIECTTPSIKSDQHECYERSLASQQATVGSITSAVMAASSCANTLTPPSLEAVRVCVQQALATGRN